MDNKNQIIIDNYSRINSSIYENRINKNFLYGNETKKFVQKLNIKDENILIADIGCGTGFVFEIILKELKLKNIKLVGIDPAIGMLKVAKKKIKSKNINFIEGSFENIPLKNKSVDKIISTLALHWVTSLDEALKEMKRVMKKNGCINILMIEKNDGRKFKRTIYKIMKKYLSIKQIISAAKLLNRITNKDLNKKFSKYFDLKKDYNLKIILKKKKIYGSCEEHIKWWKARSLQIISEVKNKKLFINDLKKELKKSNTSKGIPFDLKLLEINLNKKN